MPLMDSPGPVHNVIFFGECGVGKSSVINLVVGPRAAKTSSDADACTTRANSYDVAINGKNYRLWDTAGLDGGSFGRFRAAVAEKNLKTFVRKLLRKRELSLFIYCVRASRATQALVRNYQLIRSETHDIPVPMAIVVTGLENSREDMENWWDRNANRLSNHGMDFVDHACITSIDDDSRDLTLARTRRAFSQGAVKDLISRNCVSCEQRGITSQLPAERKYDMRERGWVANVWTYLVSAVLW